MLPTGPIWRHTETLKPLIPAHAKIHQFYSRLTDSLFRTVFGDFSSVIIPFSWWTRGEEVSRATNDGLTGRDEGDWFIADVLALKRDIPLVQRFNHLLVKYVSTSPARKNGERRSERRGDEHEGLFGLCIDYSFFPSAIKHTKAQWVPQEWKYSS